MRGGKTYQSHTVKELNCIKPSLRIYCFPRAPLTDVPRKGSLLLPQPQRASCS